MKNLLKVASILAWTLLAGLAYAQNSQAQSNPDLQGRVINAKEQNIANALIRLKGTEQAPVYTDQQGAFSFAALPVGEYQVDVEVSNSKHYHTTIDHQGDAITINIDNLKLDDLVVTANPLEHNQLKMTTPVAILTEEDLVVDRGLSLDQTLNQISGVNSGSFGTGSGQIVIRGQQGPRVMVLNNNITNQDAAAVSPDHWITSEPLLAKQVEVLKGPATLLYGGGAVGGLVNVVDDTIPTQPLDGLSGGIEGRFSDSAVGERAGVLSLNYGFNDQFAAHFSYFDSQTDDYEIPGEAESEILHEAEGHDDEEEEEEESMGILENSSVDSKGVNVGFSVFNDNGYWGLSYSDFDRNYGIPGHEHGHEDEHHDDGISQTLAVARDDDDEEEEEEEIVRIDLDKSVFNLKGVHRFGNGGFFNQFRTHYSNTDYQHIELEGDEIGTVFDNQADEFRFELGHTHFAGFEGVWGFQWSNRDFSAVGEEAYILPSETQIWSLFLVEERDFDGWHGEFGIRYDDQTVDTALFNDITDSALSVSLGATFDLNERWTLPVNLTSAQRLPTAEELFSNQSGADELVPHLATSTIEIGNPDLTHETSNNLDLGLRYRHDGLSFNLSFFYNQLDDYIFLRDTGLEEEETPIFVYTQRNTTFHGFETDLGYEFTDSFNNQWAFRVFADMTEAELNSGENVPRIPAERYGVNIDWMRGNWSASLDHTHVGRQSTLAPFELPTEGYDLLDLSVNWVHYTDQLETLIFLKGSNLLDEEIRDHASFIKDIAPRPGRSITAGFRLTF
ncbi:TonB-dependent receptor [Marinicella meishanensis]|uniref:TonB-dependent receptor n=1 Tax=Marinicella meishanensis TaxID=2873263 RepID=UPI001CBEA9D9|nr:TonB-dependent receptor [Marinicella sp. NBU2979]